MAGGMQHAATSGGGENDRVMLLDASGATVAAGYRRRGARLVFSSPPLNALGNESVVETLGPSLGSMQAEVY